LKTTLCLAFHRRQAHERAEERTLGEVVRLYWLGLTMAEIAGLYGVSGWTIASRLDQAGVTRRTGNSQEYCRLSGWCAVTAGSRTG